MKDTHIHLRRVGDRVEVTGTPACTLGFPFTDETGRRQGIFTEWRWDGRRLVATNDRYGIHPCFYFQREGEVCLSPSIHRLIAEGASTALDEPALASFLYVGHYFGEDTAFKDIRHLPPGAVLEWQDGRFNLTSTFRHPTPQRMSRDDAVDAYLACFAKAVERCLAPSDNVGFPLSGGKDSRQILFELCHQGRPPRFCVTMDCYPPRPREDQWLAPLVAKALGLEHRLIEQQLTYFQAEFRKNVLTNFCSDEHQWAVGLGDYLNGRVDAVYDGLGGGLANLGPPKSPDARLLFEAGDWPALARHLFHCWRIYDTVGTAIARLLGRRMAERLSAEVAYARVIDEMKRHLDAPRPLSAMRFFTTTRREMAMPPYCMMDGVPEVFAPYVDHDLFDLLTSITNAAEWDGTVREGAVARRYPRYADLPLTERVAHRSARAQDAAYARELAGYSLRRPASGLLRNGYLRPRMLACLISRRYAASTYWFAPIALYLLQLDAAARGGGLEACPGWTAPLA